MSFTLRKTLLGLIAIAVSLVLSARAGEQAGASSHVVSYSETAGQVTLANDYLELVFDRAKHTILHLAADHTGKRKFGFNLLALDGIRCDDGEETGASTTRIEVLEPGPQRITLRLTWLPGGSGEGDTAALTLSLGAADRGVHVEMTWPASARSIVEARVRMAFRQWMLLGIFDRGVVQYVAGQRKAFISRDPLRLFYTMDRAYGSVAVAPDDRSVIAESALVSGDGTFATGIELRPQASQETADAWTPLSLSSLAAPLKPPVPSAEQSQKRTVAFEIYANDLSFPTHHAENMIGGSEQAEHDSAAYFAAVYGSAAGVLGSYAEPGSAYPTLATPDRPYGDAFNFFDYDEWPTVATLSYSGDPLLQVEARKILERSEAAMRDDGQMPHHFENGAPTYISIAKSNQTGPNIFWVLAASEYAAGSGDESWLRAHYAHLRQATNWILAKYDSAHELLRADGPLFIDVFRRSGYTLDTNVMALYLLDQMADVAEFCGDTESAERYRGMRSNLSAGIRDQLWNGEDHFITQRNQDGSTLDKVDYDGNFAALAFGVPDPDNARKLLHRLDAGAQTHPGMRGTWVSERRYEKNDCYGGNDGDSDVAMARIWWLDMATRVRMGDRNTFEALLDNVESDLRRDVWMPERYDAAGLPAHNSYYHEYPEIISMVMREMRYGVRVGMMEVTIHPFDSANFDLRLGKLRVTFSRDAIAIEVPGSTMRAFNVGGLRPRTRYKISTGESLATDAEGMLRFHARAGELIHVARSEN
jgi:hypothetical protein